MVGGEGSSPSPHASSFVLDAALGHLAERAQLDARVLHVL